jgi:hypothetical protein
VNSTEGSLLQGFFASNVFISVVSSSTEAPSGKCETIYNGRSGPEASSVNI